MELLMICLSAFIGVFVLLTVLALIMRCIILLFPYKEMDDAAVIAAVSATISAIYPGTKITKIEETK